MGQKDDLVGLMVTNGGKKRTAPKENIKNAGKG